MRHKNKPWKWKKISLSPHLSMYVKRSQSMSKASLKLGHYICYMQLHMFSIWNQNSFTGPLFIIPKQYKEKQCTPSLLHVMNNIIWGSNIQYSISLATWMCCSFYEHTQMQMTYATSAFQVSLLICTASDRNTEQCCGPRQKIVSSKETFDFDTLAVIFKFTPCAFTKQMLGNLDTIKTGLCLYLISDLNSNRM